MPSGVTAFNIVAAVVMGAIGIGALILNPPSAHDICLAIVSGLTGALAGGGAAKVADKIPNTDPQPPTKE